MRVPPDKRKPADGAAGLQFAAEVQKGQIEDSEKKLSSQVKWNRANPQARRAHSLVAQAVKRGDLKRRPCIICGDPKVDLHHGDAGEPLAVVPLCRLHHRRLHARGWAALLAEAGP